MNAINHEANVSKNFLLKKYDQMLWLLGDQKYKNGFNEMYNICVLVFEKISLGSFSIHGSLQPRELETSWE